MDSKVKVLGVGGIFFKCKNPDKINEWYSNNFGFQTDDYGTMFESKSVEEPDRNLFLQWAPFPKDTKHFSPSEKEFMINYIVDDIEAVVKTLKENGVTILDDIEEYDYGKFVHIMDPEHNKIELWEPKQEFVKDE